MIARTAVKLTGVGKLFSGRVALGQHLGRGVRWLIWKIFGPSKDGTVEVHGNRMHLTGMEWGSGVRPFLGFLVDRYEEETTQLVERTLKPGMTMIDIGAHVGYFSLLAARAVGETGHVYAFEPESENFAALLKNVNMNGYRNVVGVNKAVTDHSGKMSFYVSNRGTGTHSLLPHFPGDETETEVETITLDDFLRSQGWPDVHLIKLDIEGSEPAALRGMQETLARLTGVRLVVEFSPDDLAAGGVQPRVFLNQLQSVGFSIQVLSRRTPVSIESLDIDNLVENLSGDRYVNLLCEKQGGGRMIKTSDIAVGDWVRDSKPASHSSLAGMATSLEWVGCNMCGGTDTKEFLRARDTLLDKPEVFTIVQCCQCNLVYLNPRPTQEKIGVYYQSDYFDAVGTGAVRSPVLRFLLNRLGRLSGKVENFPPGRVLDVGCGEGRYLKYFQDRGWDAYGVDPSRVVIVRAQTHGLKVFEGDVASTRFPDLYFDLVLMRYSIENMHDPSTTLREARRVLKPSGKLFLTAPLISSPLARLMGQYSSCLDVPRHLYFYTPETLQAMLCANGFRIAKLSKVAWLGVFQDFVMRYSPRRLRRWLAHRTVHRILWLALFPLAVGLAVLGVNRGNIELIAEKEKIVGTPQV